MVAFVGVSRDQLARARAGGLDGPVDAFAVTAGLRETFSLAASEDEEAERAALLVAGLSALQSYGARLVLVCESLSGAGDGSLGEVTLDRLDWGDVTAIFGDDTTAELAASRARDAAGGLNLDAAWDAPEVQALMADHDLLWYGPDEVDTLLGA